MDFMTPGCLKHVPPNGTKALDDRINHPCCSEFTGQFAPMEIETVKKGGEGRERIADF